MKRYAGIRAALRARMDTLKQAETSPAAFARVQSRGRWRTAPHLELLSQSLARALFEGGRRIMVWMPPRHGKSELTSGYTPCWVLDRRPQARVLLVSYGAQFASRWGRRGRNLAKDPGGPLRFHLAPDSKAAHEWETTQGGGLKTAGVGGDLTGRGFDFGIIDDPVKSAAEAWSQTYRDAAWDWWTSTFYTRCEPGASIVVVQTRWHEDDLSGRILSESQEPWEIIRIPALAEEDDVLGRPVGAPLWAERYGVEDLAKIRHAVGSWVWTSLYQQSPSPGEGAIWKAEWFRSWAPAEDTPHMLLADGAPPVSWTDCRRFLTVDLAMTEKQSSDYTVIATWAARGKWLYLLDLHRRRMEAPEILRAVADMYRRWAVAFATVEVVQGQLYIAQLLRRESGLTIQEHRPDASKQARYMGAAPKWERGEVFFPAQAPWRKDLENELLSVPAARHDDQADACVLAELVCSGPASSRPADLLPGASRAPLPGLGLAKPGGRKPF